MSERVRSQNLPWAPRTGGRRRNEERYSCLAARQETRAGGIIVPSGRPFCWQRPHIGRGSILFRADRPIDASPGADTYLSLSAGTRGRSSFRRDRKTAGRERVRETRRESPIPIRFACRIDAVSSVSLKPSAFSCIFLPPCKIEKNKFIYFRMFDKFAISLR